MEDYNMILDERLPIVLDIILTRPDQIVDDTYIEKLTTWLDSVASDGSEECVLLRPETNILGFLSSKPDVLFGSQLCANFALRLAGILAGSSRKSCLLLRDDGILENLFGRYQDNKCAFEKSALMRYAFFEGISVMLKHSIAYSWVLERKGFLSFAIQAFTDSSFYVSSSSKKFLERLLQAAVAFDSELEVEGKDSIIKFISTECKKATLKEKHHYLELVSHIFESDPRIAVLLLGSIGGLQSFLYNLHLEQRGSRLLQTITDICFKALCNECNSYPGCIFFKSTAKENLETSELLLNVAVCIAKEGIENLFFFLTKTICGSRESFRVWNEVALFLVLFGIFNENVDKTSDTLFHKEAWEHITHNFPEASISHIKKLESMMKKHLVDRILWRKCLSSVLEANTELFCKGLRETCSEQGRSSVEQLVQFLSDLMVIQTTSSNENLQSKLDADLISVCSGWRGLPRKCAMTIRQILINDWFAESQAETNLNITNATIKLLNDSTKDSQTLSAGIKLFSCLLEKMSTQGGNTEAHFEANEESDLSQSSISKENHWFGLIPNLPSTFEKLLNDDRWEVRDSAFDMVFILFTKADGNKYLCDFLVKYQFWSETLLSLDADESYLRASAVHLIGVILENARTRGALFKHISMDTLFEKMLAILKEDDEAFPKRSLLEATYRWLELREVQDVLLSFGTDVSTKSHESCAEKLCELIFEILDISAKSFDWEIKLKGINCWLKILKASYKDLRSLDVLSEKSDSGTEGVLKRDEFTSTLSLFCFRKGATNLVLLLNDCDHLVRKGALETLQYVAEKTETTLKKHGVSIESCYDMENYEDISFSTRDDFLRFLGQIDFQQLTASIKLADEGVANNPASLLDDIISAANNTDDNLIDCY